MTGYASSRRQGFTLLELMLAMALGVTIAAAVAQLFIGTSRAQAQLGGQALMQEAARHALDFLTRSARGAGFLGCGAAGNLVNGLNGAWRQLVEFDLTTPIEAFDGVGGVWTPSLAALPLRDGSGSEAFSSRSRIDARRLAPDSDVVVFRRADRGTPLARPLQSRTDALVVADDADLFDADDFVVVSSCGQAALLRVTSAAGAAGARTLARAGGIGAFGNRTGVSLMASTEPYGGAAGPEGAVAALMLTEVYFVARARADNNRGQPVWSLWRKTSAAAPAELVQGIDDLQLLFGIDTTPEDAVDAPERYVQAEGIGDGVVRTVHISVTASSVNAVTADNQVLRRTFSRTVALRN